MGKEHPSTATTYNNMAGVYADLGEYAKSLVWYEKAGGDKKEFEEWWKNRKS